MSRTDKFFEIQNQEELYIALTRRKHWKQIRPELVRAIIENCHGNLERMKEFVVVSEQYKIVQNNFLKQQDLWNKNTLSVLSSFSLTMLRLGQDLWEALPSMPEGSEQQKQAITYCGLGFWAATYCDPFQLAAYNGLGWLYHTIGLTNRAVEMCQELDRVIQLLIDAPDEVLSEQNKLRRAENDLAKMRNVINYLKKEVGLPHEPLLEIKNTSYCLYCSKDVEPTMHGTCPECGNFLPDLS